VMLMPHGEPTLPELKATRERERFGKGRIQVDPKLGDLLDTYPVRVRADDEVARFTLEGAFDQTPLIVEGFKGWKVPLLWWNGIWQDQQVHGGDGYQVEPDGAGGYRFIFVYPIRKGQKLDLLVTRAESTAGISRMFDRNGELVLESDEEGDFRLKTPRLFAPGRNVWHGERGLAEFTVRGKRVQSVPISFVSCDHGAVAEILEHTADSAKVRTENGPMALRFSGLAKGAAYVVDIDGTRSDRTSDVHGTIAVETTAATATVALGLKDSKR